MLQKTRYRILTYLYRKESHGYEIANNLKISKTIVYAYLSELINEGLIELVKKSDRKKIYRITQKGKKLIQLFNDKEKEVNSN